MCRCIDKAPFVMELGAIADSINSWDVVRSLVALKKEPLVSRSKEQCLFWINLTINTIFVPFTHYISTHTLAPFFCLCDTSGFKPSLLHLVAVQDTSPGVASGNYSRKKNKLNIIISHLLS